MRKSQSLINKYISVFTFLAILLVWQCICYFEFVPKFMLPSPLDVVSAFISDFNLLLSHLIITLFEAFAGLLLSIIFSFITAILMDRFNLFYRAIYPIIIISQTIPTIAIAPIIILWFGFGMLPKILLIFMTCFFPIVISILSGFRSVDQDLLKFMDSIGSSYVKTLFLVKIPFALRSFFSGLKIASSYAIVGAVVSEWLGGDKGIGVYMTRVKKAYSFDKMFASIIIISLLSLLLVFIIKKLEDKVIFWED